MTFTDVNVFQAEHVDSSNSADVKSEVNTKVRNAGPRVVATAKPQLASAVRDGALLLESDGASVAIRSPRRAADVTVDLLGWMDFSTRFMTLSKVTSFKISSDLFRRAHKLADESKKGISDLLAIALFTEISINRQENFVACKVEDTAKTSVRLPLGIVELTNSFAKAHQCSASEVVNTALCRFLNMKKKHKK